MTEPATLLTTTSADGTTIAYERMGTGPALVVLPGAMNTAESWRAVGTHLAADHTVVLANRRFYAPSGPGPAPSSFAAEAADVRALIDAAGGSAHVVGHSYGGLLALHAAVADPAGIRSLILYEAPVTAVERLPGGFLDDYRARLAEQPFAAIMLFLQTVVNLPVEDMASLSAGQAGAAPPTAEEIAGLAEALLHDLEALDGDALPVGAFTGIGLPTLLLAGGQSWDVVRESTDALRAALPAAEFVSWPGQTHFANMLAPAMVADTIREFVGRVAQ